MKSVAKKKGLFIWTEIHAMRDDAIQNVWILKIKMSEGKYVSDVQASLYL